MVTHFLAYTLLHQPRRLRLPAPSIPTGATAAEINALIFDDEANERLLRETAKRCYYPATELFHRLVNEGFKLNLGISFSLIRQIQRWEPPLLEQIQALVSHPHVELVAVDPYQSVLSCLDPPAFVRQVAWARDELHHQFDKRPTIVDAQGVPMTRELHRALHEADWQGALVNGEALGQMGAEPTSLYQPGEGPVIFSRHGRLSEDVNERFSNVGWDRWPLMADDYADWVEHCPGEFVMVGWEYEALGMRHPERTGIFDFVGHLPVALRERNIDSLTFTEAAQRFSAVSWELPLPGHPAGAAQVEEPPVLQLMHLAYQYARQTHNPELLDLAVWLTQSDHLGFSPPQYPVGAERRPDRSFFNGGRNGADGDGREAELQAVLQGFMLSMGEQRAPTTLPGLFETYRAVRGRGWEAAPDAAMEEPEAADAQFYARG